MQTLPVWRRILIQELHLPERVNAFHAENGRNVEIPVYLHEEFYHARQEAERAKLVADFLSLIHGDDPPAPAIEEGVLLSNSLIYSQDNRKEILRAVVDQATTAQLEGRLDHNLLKTMQLFLSVRSLSVGDPFAGDDAFQKLRNQFPSWLEPKSSTEASLTFQNRKTKFLKSLLISSGSARSSGKFSLAMTRQTLHSNFQKLIRRSQNTFAQNFGAASTAQTQSTRVTGANPALAMERAEFLDPSEFSETENQLIESLETQAAAIARNGGGFPELGTWLVTLRNGVQIEIPCSPGTFTQIDGFLQLRRKLGQKVRHFAAVKSIQFFHIHPPNFRRLSAGDFHAVKKVFTEHDDLHGGIARALTNHPPFAIDFHVYAISRRVSERSIHHMGFPMYFGQR